MTRDDIIQLALEHFGAVLKPSDLEVQLAVLAVAAEREACAKVCENIFQTTPLYTTYAQAAQDCAEAIWARGET
jgi:hypothetical protein